MSGAPLQLWDNSTRGLDSANAIEFCRTLKLSTEMSGATAAVAIYQAPQAAYDVFDKVLLLFVRFFFLGGLSQFDTHADLGTMVSRKDTKSTFVLPHNSAMTLQLT